MFNILQFTILIKWLYNKCWGKKNRAYEKNIKK